MEREQLRDRKHRPGDLPEGVQDMNFGKFKRHLNIAAGCIIDDASCFHHSPVFVILDQFFPQLMERSPSLRLIHNV